MIKDRLLFILNPAAGGGKSLKWLPSLRKKIEQLNLPYQIILSQSEAHLGQLVRELAGKEQLIVGVGGDSTFNLMANELLKSGRSSTLAFIGLGSSNDIARELGLLPIDRALQAIKRGREKMIDVAAITYQGETVQYVLGQVNIGLGVYVNEYVARLIARQPFIRKWQNLAGLLAIISAYRKKQTLWPLSIETSNKNYSGLFMIALLTNLRYWASGRKIAPHASPEDGRFDLCLIKNCSPALFFFLAILASYGGHQNLKPFVSHQDNHFRIFGEKKFRLQADGEIIKIDGQPLEIDNFELTVLSRALKIMA